MFNEVDKEKISRQKIDNEEKSIMFREKLMGVFYTWTNVWELIAQKGK